MNNHFFLLNMLRGYNRPGSEKESIELLREAIRNEYTTLPQDRKNKFSKSINTLNSNNDIISLWDIYTEISGGSNTSSSELQKKLDSCMQENNKLKLVKTIGYSLVPTVDKLDDSKLKDYISENFLKKIKELYTSIEEEKNKSVEYYKTSDSSKLEEIKASQVNTNESIEALQKELSRLSVLRKNLEVISDPSKASSSLFSQNYNHGVYLITQKRSSDYIKHILYSVIINMIYSNEGLHSTDNIMTLLLLIKNLNIIYILFNQPDFINIIKGNSSSHEYKFSSSKTINTISDQIYSAKLNNNIYSLINNFELNYTNFNTKLDEIINNLLSITIPSTSSSNKRIFYINSIVIATNPTDAQFQKTLKGINIPELYNQFLILIRLLEEFDSNFTRIHENSSKLLEVANVDPQQAIQADINLTEIFKSYILDSASRDLDWMANRSVLSNVMDDLSDLIRETADDVECVRKFSNMCINPQDNSSMEKKYLKYKKKYLKLKE